MPRGNGMGPNGMGPMSGRAQGYCAGNGMPGYLNAAQTWRGGGGLKGCGGVFGRGRGNRNMFFATGLTGWQRAAADFRGTVMSPEQELTVLRTQSIYMEEQLEKARARMAELEKEGGKE
jgi:hypothetical protein